MFGRACVLLTLLAGINPAIVQPQHAQRGVALETPAQAPKATTGRYFALVIGINSYHGSLRPLETAERDASEVGRLLNTEYGFQVQTLLGSNATRNNILRAVHNYRSSLSDDDNLLIYYAGHGEQDADSTYWLPADAEDASSPNRIITEELTAEIRGLPARHVLVIADSCFAGGFGREVGVVSATQGHEVALRRELLRRSRSLMASGGKEPVTDRGRDGHSIFAYALLQGLRDETQAMFSGSDLFVGGVRDLVVGNAKQSPEYKHISDSGDDGGGDFIFVRKNAVVPVPKVVSSRPSAGAGSAHADNQADAAGLSLEQTWTDPATGVTWMVADNGSPIGAPQAALYCKSLRVDGADWRLPSIEELTRIVDVPGPICMGMPCHIKPNFHISASSLWSNETQSNGWTALFDFRREQKIVLYPDFDNVRALCVKQR